MSDQEKQYSNGNPQGPPQRKRSQADQDKDDEKARKKAEQDLIQSWMDRMQLISVITTFFAANEAQLLSITTPQGGPDPAVMQTSNAMLAGALVLHSFSAVVAFIGAFLLVRFKLKEAKKDEAKEQGNNHPKSDNDSQVWSSNPHLEQTGYFLYRSQRPPIHLLHRTHSIAVVAAFVGFVFGIVGIICYTWAQQPTAVGAFSTACIGACLVISFAILGPALRATENENE